LTRICSVDKKKAQQEGISPSSTSRLLPTMLSLLTLVGQHCVNYVDFDVVMLTLMSVVNIFLENFGKNLGKIS
jgi:hypothetical protein